MIFSELPTKIGAARDIVRMKIPENDDDAAHPTFRATFAIPAAECPFLGANDRCCVGLGSRNIHLHQRLAAK